MNYLVPGISLRRAVSMKNEMLAIFVIGLFGLVFDSCSAEARTPMDTGCAEHSDTNGLTFANLQIGQHQSAVGALEEINLAFIARQCELILLRKTIIDFASTADGKAERGLAFVAATQAIIASAGQGQSPSIDLLSQLVMAAQPFVKEMTLDELMSFKSIISPLQE